MNQVEDEDTEREEEEDECDKKDKVHKVAWAGVKATRRQVGINGGEVWMKKGVIGGGWRVYRHIWKRKRDECQTEKVH